MTKVLFLLGIDDSNQVTMRRVGPKGPVYDLQGSVDVSDDLRHPELKKKTVVLGGSDPFLPNVPRPDVIFNCIADADCSARALRLAMQLIQQHKVPVVNRPVHVLKNRRDDVAAALAGIPGVAMPATVRLRPASVADILAALATGPVRYPAILRRIGTHGGESMILLSSAEDAALLERVACDGTEYFLTSFVDFRDEDGLYRKTRLVVIGDRVFARHQLASTHWNVHASTRLGLMTERPALAQAEEAFLKSFGKTAFPPLAERLGTMKQRLKLDYYSIDCSLRPNGDLLVFEANPGGNALRQGHLDKFPYLRRPLQQMRASLSELLLQQTA
ncbi:MAG: ATP-grasp domain-containing protein [Pseudomonadota bacterium]